LIISSAARATLQAGERALFIFQVSPYKTFQSIIGVTLGKEPDPLIPPSAFLKSSISIFEVIIQDIPDCESTRDLIFKK
jgi:hypothetical protein